MLRDKFRRTWHCFKLQAVLTRSNVICAPICKASQVCESRVFAPGLNVRRKIVQNTTCNNTCCARKGLFNNMQKSERHRRDTHRQARSQVDKSIPKNGNRSQHTSMHENDQATQSTTRFAGVHGAKSGNHSLCTFFSPLLLLLTSVISFSGLVGLAYIFKCFAVWTALLPQQLVEGRLRMQLTWYVTPEQENKFS